MDRCRSTGTKGARELCVPCHQHVVYSSVVERGRDSDCGLAWTLLTGAETRDGGRDLTPVTREPMGRRVTVTARSAHVCQNDPTRILHPIPNPPTIQRAQPRGEGPLAPGGGRRGVLEYHAVHLDLDP